MADFKTIGNVFQRGLRGVGSSEYTYSAGNNTTVIDAALANAGRQFVEFFQSRIIESGPGWEPLTEDTLRERERRGYGGNEPLAETRELLDSITYRISDPINFRLEVGVEDKQHGERDNRGPISMEDLVYIQELGLPGIWGEHVTELPARPIFSDSPEYEVAEQRIVAEFVEEVFSTKHRFGTVRRTRH